jgi:hypothetical protein
MTEGNQGECRYFYTTLLLGTPPREFSVIIDTGSTITYIPCKECAHCGKHTVSSSTLRAVCVVSTSYSCMREENPDAISLHGAHLGPRALVLGFLSSTGAQQLSTALPIGLIS